MTQFYYSFRQQMRRRDAFTLIELLIVTAIIALLASILFPVFTRAKEAAKKTQCISNVKNITLAFILYAEDYGDVAPPFQSYVGPLYTLINLWGAGPYTYGALFDPHMKGYLYPYLKNQEIQSCLTSKDLSEYSSAGPIGYVNNSGYISTASLSYLDMNTLELPAETIFIGDAASFNTIKRRIEKCYPLYNLYTTTVCGLHARHNQVATVGWLDGHSKAHTLSYSINYPSDIDKTIGALLKFPAVDPINFTNGVDQFYYRAHGKVTP